MTVSLNIFEAGAIDSVRRDIMARAKNGVCSCPVCGQYVKVYARTIYRSAAKQLIHLYLLGGAERFVHISAMANARDFQISRHWSLIETMPNDDPDKRTPGLWKLTESGVDFIMRRATVPRYIFIQNNKVLGCSDERAGIDDCLGKKFSYEELMNDGRSSVLF